MPEPSAYDQALAAAAEAAAAEEAEPADYYKTAPAEEVDAERLRLQQAPRRHVADDKPPGYYKTATDAEYREALAKVGFYKSPARTEQH